MNYLHLATCDGLGCDCIKHNALYKETHPVITKSDALNAIDRIRWGSPRGPAWASVLQYLIERADAPQLMMVPPTPANPDPYWSAWSAVWDQLAAASSRWVTSPKTNVECAVNEIKRLQEADLDRVKLRDEANNLRTQLAESRKIHDEIVQELRELQRERTRLIMPPPPAAPNWFLSATSTPDNGRSVVLQMASSGYYKTGCWDVYGKMWHVDGFKLPRHYVESWADLPK